LYFEISKDAHFKSGRKGKIIFDKAPNPFGVFFEKVYKKFRQHYFQAF